MPRDGVSFIKLLNMLSGDVIHGYSLLVAGSSGLTAGRNKMAATFNWVVLSVQIGIVLILVNTAVSKICHIRPYHHDEINHNNENVYFGALKSTVYPEYICPRPNDPTDYSECCSYEAPQCCPPERFFYEIDNTLATAIAVTVSLTCLAGTILIILCCFWSKCPLYNACRVQYSTQGEIIYGKENETRNVMPSDTPSRKNAYSCPKLSSNSSKASLV